MPTAQLLKVVTCFWAEVFEKLEDNLLFGVSVLAEWMSDVHVDVRSVSSAINTLFVSVRSHLLIDKNVSSITIPVLLLSPFQECIAVADIFAIVDVDYQIALVTVEVTFLFGLERFQVLIPLSWKEYLAIESSDFVLFTELSSACLSLH